MQVHCMVDYNKNMRKIIVSEFVSVDNIFEDPGGAEGYKHGGWSMKFNTSASMRYKYEELKNADALLLGRKTYEGFAKTWPKVEGTGEFGEWMNNYPKYVVSSTLQSATWNNSHIIKDNIAEEIKKLKQQEGKNILVGGSGQLVRFLLDEGLVDKLCLMVCPIVLGEGKKLLESVHKKGIKLLEVKKYDNGVLALEYEPSQA
jgi:dihydrofolate reductase